MTAGAARLCWCGNAALAPFSAQYGLCTACGTLVFNGTLTPEQFAVRPDDTGYYGKAYWLEHQQKDLGQADIHQRARTDLPGRNLHWLRTLLRYRLPPAQVMELGCAHGSFVALMNQLGFAASGVEMSPWVVGYARETFGIAAEQGPLEALDLPTACLDVIVLMDVLEHLADPLATMRRCLELLRPDGIVLIQTPCLPEGSSYEQLVEAHHPFLDMLIPEEHIYLFGQRSVTELFQRLGAPHLAFEAAVFAQYDMCLVASRAPLRANGVHDIEAALLQTPPRRLGLALLDLRQQLEASQADGALRLEQVHALTSMLKESEADRLARARQIDTLTAMVEESRARPAGWHPLLFAVVRRLRGQAPAARRAASAPASARERAPSHGAAEPGATPEPRTIAVDLTPVLPGGENGGAKIFVLELLRRLAALAPQTEFILLTHARSHAELAGLDAVNVRRLRVAGDEMAADPPVGTAAAPLAAAGAQAPADPAPAAPPPSRRAQQARFLAVRLQAHARRLVPTALRPLALAVRDRIRLARLRTHGRSLLRDLRADLLFCPFTAPSYWEPGIPTVCTIYDLQYKTYPEFFASADVAQRDSTFRDACARAVRLAAISDYSRMSALEHGHLDPERVRTIHLRMAGRIAPGAAEHSSILARLGLEPQRYLLYPANFWRHKNHEMLLTAFGMARAAGLAADIRLVCTGAPGERQTLLANAARTMGLGDRVLFPGFLPEADLAALMAGCVGVVFPSLYEGFGLPVIEAMAAGIPVACSSSTSLPEVAAEAALMFDPRVPTAVAAAITSLVADAALRQRLTENGRRRAAEFSDSGRMAREYWTLFQDTLAVRRQGAQRA